MEVVMRKAVVLAIVVGCAGICIVNAEPGNFLFPRLYVRGDCNNDGVLDISDVVSNLAYQFGHQNAMDRLCTDAADVNDDGDIDIADVIYSLGYLFAQGPPPPAPFPVAGEDPTEDGLGCWEYTAWPE
jgi:hypothetical protein